MIRHQEKNTNVMFVVKKINKCETYSRHYSRGMSEAITLHPECYEKQLKKEVGLKQSKRLI